MPEADNIYIQILFIRTRMRLLDTELGHIRSCFVRHFGPQSHLWVFGSRTEDTRLGGDIDLYIETDADNPQEIWEKKVDFIIDLKSKLGDQRIDVVIQDPEHPIPIYTIARTQGHQLI
jgi:hypothetical protein